MANLHDWGHLTLPYFLKSNYDTPREGKLPASGLLRFQSFRVRFRSAFAALWRRRNYTQKSSGTAVGPSRWPERRCSRPSLDSVSCWRRRSISSFVNGEKFLVIVVFCSSMARVGMPTTAVVTGKLME